MTNGNTPWSSTVASDDLLNRMTHLSGSTSERTASTNWPTYMPWFNTTDLKWYKNVGSSGTPLAVEIGTTGQSGDLVYPLSTSSSDYNAATSVTLSSGSTVDLPDFSDDFSGTDNWTDADSAKIGVSTTNDRIDFTFIGDNTNDTCYYDLGAGNVSDSAWILRFSIYFDSIVNDNSGGTINFIGIGDNTSARTSAQDFIGWRVGTVTGNLEAYAIDSDGASMLAGEDGHNLPVSATTVYYAQIRRLSTTTYDVKLFSDSTYTTQVGSTCNGTCPSTITGGRYIKIMNINGSFSNSVSGRIDDVKFYNGVTTPNTKSTTNSEANPYIYYDFSSARDHTAFCIKLDTVTNTLSQFKIRCSTDTSFSDDETVRTLNESDFTNNTNRYILINRLSADCRYVQVYGIGTGVLSIYYLTSRYGLTDAQWGRNHYHKKLNTTTVMSETVDSN